MPTDAEITARIESVTPYIQKCANTFSAAFQVDRDDLMQAGRIAAADCARRFESERGHSYFQFASGNIYWLVMREAARIAPMVRISRGKTHLIDRTRGSLDAILPGAGDEGYENQVSSYLDSILCDEVTPADHAHRADERALLNAALANLDPRVARCVTAHVMEGRKLDDIGRAEGVSGERIRQLVNDGLRALRFNPAIKRLRAA